jgi:taurine dioxygenase
VVHPEDILGLAEEEALALLAELIEHATQPKYEYRHQWRPGDLVIWDNRSLPHRANGDYDMDQVRYFTAYAAGRSTGLILIPAD